MPNRALLGALGLLIAGCGSTGSPATTTTTSPAMTSAPVTTTMPVGTTTGAHLTATTVFARFQIVGGVFQGPESLPVDLGETFEIEVVADATDVLHVHGYDLLFELVADEPTLIRFVADAPGVFEVELEGAHAHLFEIEVGA
jgi:hypothetical protein